MTKPPGHISQADPGWLARQGLHIYGQEVWHDDAWIVGGPEALQNLILAIARAINAGHSEQPYYVNDGEGYDLHVICEPVDQRHEVPYSDEIAMERRRDARGPDDAATEQGWHAAG